MWRVIDVVWDKFFISFLAFFLLLVTQTISFNFKWWWLWWRWLWLCRWLQWWFEINDEIVRSKKNYMSQKINGTNEGRKYSILWDQKKYPVFFSTLNFLNVCNKRIGSNSEHIIQRRWRWWLWKKKLVLVLILFI